MSGVRRLRDPGRRARVHARARHRTEGHGLRLGHRVQRTVHVLHGHLRVPRDPRARARDRDRRGDGEPRSPRVGRDGRRRRALDRGQPPDPRPAPQREHQDPDVQQPDLRAHEGAVLAHLRRGQGHEIHPVRVGRPSLQPHGAGAGGRRHVRGADDRQRPPAPDRRLAPSGAAPGAAFVEIYQNCNVFNDGAFDVLRDKPQGVHNQIRLVHGEPIVFDEGTRCVRVGENGRLEIAAVADSDPASIVTHDVEGPPSLAFALAHLSEGPTQTQCDRCLPRGRATHLRRRGAPAGGAGARAARARAAWRRCSSRRRHLDGRSAARAERGTGSAARVRAAPSSGSSHPGRLPHRARPAAAPPTKPGSSPSEGLHVVRGRGGTEPDRGSRTCPG